MSAIDAFNGHDDQNSHANTLGSAHPRSATHAPAFNNEGFQMGPRQSDRKKPKKSGSASKKNSTLAACSAAKREHNPAAVDDGHENHQNPTHANTLGAVHVPPCNTEGFQVVARHRGAKKAGSTSRTLSAPVKCECQPAATVRHMRSLPDNEAGAVQQRVPQFEAYGTCALITFVLAGVLAAKLQDRGLTPAVVDAALTEVWSRIKSLIWEILTNQTHWLRELMHDRTSNNYLAIDLRPLVKTHAHTPSAYHQNLLENCGFDSVESLCWASMEVGGAAHFRVASDHPFSFEAINGVNNTVGTASKLPSRRPHHRAGRHGIPERIQEMLAAGRVIIAQVYKVAFSGSVKTSVTHCFIIYDVSKDREWFRAVDASCGCGGGHGPFFELAAACLDGTKPMPDHDFPGITNGHFPNSGDDMTFFAARRRSAA